MGARARVWPGIPAVPGRERRGRGGQAAPSKPLAAGPAPRQAFSSPLPGGSPATLVHRTGSTGLPRRASAAVASQEEEEEGRGAPHANLGTCSQSTRRCSPRESRKGLELRRARESPVRSRPPRRRAEADPAVPRRRRRARPPAPGAHGGGKIGVGSWLAAGAPEAGAPLSVVLKPRSPPAPRRLVLLRNQLFRSLLPLPPPPVPRAGYSNPPSTHRRANTHTARTHTHTISPQHTAAICRADTPPERSARAPRTPASRSHMLLITHGLQ